MHIRKKKVMRNEIRYMIDGEEIPMMSCYIYLGCVVDEHLDLKEMVQDEVVAGKKALGAWFQWCRVEVGDIGIGKFKKQEVHEPRQGLTTSLTLEPSIGPNVTSPPPSIHYFSLIYFLVCTLLCNFTYQL